MLAGKGLDLAASRFKPISEEKIYSECLRALDLEQSLCYIPTEGPKFIGKRAVGCWGGECCINLQKTGKKTTKKKDIRGYTSPFFDSKCVKSQSTDFATGRQYSIVWKKSNCFNGILLEG